MIKITVEKEIKEKHLVLCPHCREILELNSIINTTEIPSGLSLSVKIHSNLPTLPYLEKQILHINELKMCKYPTKEIRVFEG